MKSPGIPRNPRGYPEGFHGTLKDAKESQRVTILKDSFQEQEAGTGAGTGTGEQGTGAGTGRGQQAKTRQTELRHATASEPAEPRQSTCT
jgi:hypothetical protein